MNEQHETCGSLALEQKRVIVIDESMIRQLVDMVKMLTANKIRDYIRGSLEIEQTVEEAQVKWCS